MPAAPDFERICSDFRQVRLLVGKTLADAEESGLRRQLQSVAETMDKNFARLLEVYPKANAEIDRRLVQTRERIAATQSKVADLKGELAAAEKARAAAAAAPKLPKAPKPGEGIDPKLGPTLREELLARFGDPPPTDAGAGPLQVREAWEDWDWEAWKRN
jgi:hypothetical protein